MPNTQYLALSMLHIRGFSSFFSSIPFFRVCLNYFSFPQYRPIKHFHYDDFTDDKTYMIYVDL